MDNKFYPVLADFGFSFYKKEYEENIINIESATGTENYFAPEIKIRGKNGKI